MHSVKSFFLFFNFISLFIFTHLSWADFYVIPVVQKIKNVVVVAQSGGQYTDIQTALDSITDAAVDKPYLLYIAPGTYTVSSTITMKPYVSMMGIDKSTTIITGAVSTSLGNTSAIISGNDNTTLGNLTIENTGGDSQSIGITINSVSTKIYNVSATASGGTSSNSGIRVLVSPSSELINVTASATGGQNSHGVYIYSSSPILTNVTAIASDSTSSSYGLYITESSSPIIASSQITVTDAVFGNYGIYNRNTSSPTIINSTINTSGGSFNNGVDNASSSSPFISKSTIVGTTNAIKSIESSIATISLSTLDGGVGLSVTQVCSLCVDENDNALGATCNLP